MYRAIGIVALLATALLGAVGLDRPMVQTRSSSGTVIIIAIETDKIILAADSRAMTDRGGHTDDDCKLLIFGKDIIFASSGEAHLGVTGPQKIVWDARAAARRSIARLPQKKDAQARDLANSPSFNSTSGEIRLRANLWTNKKSYSPPNLHNGP